MDALSVLHLDLNVARYDTENRYLTNCRLPSVHGRNVSVNASLTGRVPF